MRPLYLSFRVGVIGDCADSGLVVNVSLRTWAGLRASSSSEPSSCGCLRFLADEPGVAVFTGAFFFFFCEAVTVEIESRFEFDGSALTEGFTTSLMEGVRRAVGGAGEVAFS